MSAPTNIPADQASAMQALKRLLESYRRTNPDGTLAAVPDADKLREAADKGLLPTCFPGCGCGEKQPE